MKRESLGSDSMGNEALIDRRYCGLHEQEDSVPASCGFFGFKALRFIVAVIMSLALVLRPGLCGTRGVPARPGGNGESLSALVLFVTDQPRAIRD